MVVSRGLLEDGRESKVEKKSYRNKERGTATQSLEKKRDDYFLRQNNFFPTITNSFQKKWILQNS